MQTMYKKMQATNIEFRDEVRRQPRISRGINYKKHAQSDAHKW